MKKQIGIFSLENDLHGPYIQNAVNRHEGVACVCVSVDTICDVSPISWTSDKAGIGPAVITSSTGEPVCVKNLSLIWWRRSASLQNMPANIEDPKHRSLIQNDCSVSLEGLLLTDFNGKWVSRIDATRAAENKLVQLRAANAAGLRIPRTLVSNQPSVIREFCSDLKNKVIVKAVRGSHMTHIFTRKLAASHLASDENLRLCPAIYQEMVEGTQHLRVHCFGDEAYAVLIETQQLDWRETLNGPFKPVSLSLHLKGLLQNLLNFLGLRMGIVDFKIAEDGAPVFLEINPQGQFLFAEALSDFSLTDAFATFLVSEA